MYRMTRRTFSIGAISAAIVQPARANKDEVGAELLLSLDVSGSVTPERYIVQCEGYGGAFSDAEVQDRILTNSHGNIAVSVIQWAGRSQQDVVVEWLILDSVEGLNSFATRLKRMSRTPIGNGTDIGGAINFGYKHMKTCPFAGHRRIMDISGDGISNAVYRDLLDVRGLENARNVAINDGITINGLAIWGSEYFAPQFGYTDLTDYYEKYVIGGQGSFVETVKDADDVAAFTVGVKRKLLRELTA